MRHVLVHAAAVIGLFALSKCCSASESNTLVFTDPKEAGIDYQLQGEYLGELDTAEGKQKIGVQVIALGEGKFRAVGYVGGLPGDGWFRGDEQHIGEGELKDGEVRIRSAGSDVEQGTIGILKLGELRILHEGTTIGQLKKIERKSPTLGAKPPREAIVLFDGSNTDAWENGKLVEGELLGATGTWSKQKLGDHHLHIEFRTPFMPTARGQGRGNSGVYIQSRYECQVLDSFGLEGEDNECGGIYSIARPLLNMCLPPLAWQTYDIDFTAARFDEQGNKTHNARVTIKHNGVVIHDDLELPHGTPGRHPEGPGPESLFLQDHGNPVAFRNIWVVEK